MTSTAPTDQLPAHHPLRTLRSMTDEAIQGVLPSVTASCADADLPSIDLANVLKASVLQALYSINDSSQFVEHLQYNSLFRWFMDEDGSISSAADYAQVQAKLLENHSMSHFLDTVIKRADQEQSPNALYIANNLSRWMNKYCPKEVFFREYQRSPIKKMAYTILFPPSRHPTIPEHIFYEHAKADFPKRGKPPGDEDEQNFWDFDEPTFFSEDDQYYVTIYDTNAIELNKRAPYDTWDSFMHKLEKMIQHCKSTYAQAAPSGLACEFHNVITLPAGVDLNDYFHVTPQEPPPIQVPRLMQETGRTYEFPKLLMTTKSLTKLLYEKDPAYLVCHFEASPQEQEIKIHLDLHSVWTKPLAMEEVSSIANKLKENIYIAFHSLITDKARRMFE